jgi:hypothetical protein
MTTTARRKKSQKKLDNKDKGITQERSPHWPTVQHHFIKKHPSCAACGSKEHLNVHHVQPFHLHPELELVESNLITLCMDNDCHLLIGHGDNFKAFNPNVREDAAEILKNVENLKVVLKETAEKVKQKRLIA